MQVKKRHKIQADLPPRSIRRWTALRKQEVVRAIWDGLISRSEALSRYQLSEEELESWESAVALHGVRGLRVTKLGDFRSERAQEAGERQRGKDRPSLDRFSSASERTRRGGRRIGVHPRNAPADSE